MSVDPARLTAVPLFAALTDDERAAVAAKLEERTANVGDHLSTEGGAGYFFFVIESGGATVTRDGQTLAEFGPGDFFGEAAIFKTRRRTATVDGDGTDEAVRDVRSRLRQAGGRHPRAAHRDRRGTGGTSSRVIRSTPGHIAQEEPTAEGPRRRTRPGVTRAPTTRRPLRRAVPARPATTPSARASRRGSARRPPAPWCGARSSAATCPSGSCRLHEQTSPASATRLSSRRRTGSAMRREQPPRDPRRPAP